MSTSSVRRQAEQFVAEQGLLLRGGLTSKDAVAAALRALDPPVAAEALHLLKTRATGQSRRRPASTEHLREQQSARSTGTMTGLYDCRHADSLIPESDGGRWATVCETHGTLVQSDRYEMARWALSHPEEFCEACAAWIEGRELAAAGDARPVWQIVAELLGPSNAYAPSGPSA